MNNMTTAIISDSTLLEKDLCIAKDNSLQIITVPVNAFSIFLNFIVLVASLLDKKRLQKQNYLFACVNSAFLSHIVYLSLKIWASVAYYNAKDVAPAMLGVPKYLWSACESSVVSIAFGVVTNAASLVYITLDSTYIATREVPKSTPERVSKTSYRVRKKILALFLITVSWALPLIFICIATLWWNCSPECRCMSPYKGEICPHEYGCSRLIPPMTIGFMILHVVLFAIEVIGVIILIAKKYRGSSIRRSSFSKNRNKIHDEKLEEISTIENERIDEKIPDMLGDPEREMKVENIMTSRMRPGLTPRLRFAIILASILVICFFPFATSIVIDATSSHGDVMSAAIASDICLYVYMTLCPVLVLKYMPNLRSSLYNAAQNLKNICR